MQASADIELPKTHQTLDNTRGRWKVRGGTNKNSCNFIFFSIVPLTSRTLDSAFLELHYTSLIETLVLPHQIGHHCALGNSGHPWGSLKSTVIFFSVVYERTSLPLVVNNPLWLSLGDKFFCAKYWIMVRFTRAFVTLIKGSLVYHSETKC